MRAFALIALASTSVTVPAATQVAPSIPREVERVGTLPRGSAVTESSGVAVSRRHTGVLWTHNDSGDGPVLYAIRLTGDVIGRVELAGARAVDWEDVALGPCPDAPAQDCLFVGDVGDNLERRARGVVYIIPEPDPRALPAAVPARAVGVRFTDAAHDVESIAVSPGGDLHLVTKGRVGPILLYRVPAADLLRDSVAVAPAATLPIAPARMIGRWVTGGAIEPTSGRLVLRTYTELYFFDPATDGTWTSSGPACWLGVIEPQGEGVDFLDDDTLVLTSEATPAADGTIYRVRC